MMNYYVYEITNKLNGMKYIGKRSCLGLIEEDSYMGSGKYLWEAYNIYGQENFEKKIVKTFATVQEALNYERELIEKLDAVKSDDYYNAVGGGGGPKGGSENKNDKSSYQLIKFRLNDKNPKEKIILDFLNDTISPNEFTKQLLFDFAKGNIQRFHYINS